MSYSYSNYVKVLKENIMLHNTLSLWKWSLSDSTIQDRMQVITCWFSGIYQLYLYFWNASLLLTTFAWWDSLKMKCVISVSQKVIAKKKMSNVFKQVSCLFCFGGFICQKCHWLRQCWCVWMFWKSLCFQMNEPINDLLIIVAAQ